MNFLKARATVQQQQDNMSRGTVTKSRTDKKGGQSVPTPAVAHEIIPGKYTDQDWNSMLEKDDGEEFVADIVEDVVTIAMNKIYEGYIHRQLLPFTINQAKDAILQIIEWQFLAHDEGEVSVDKDTSWIQDEEPDPATTDCWAQGSVPKIFLPPPSPIIEEEPELEEEEEKQTEEAVEESHEEEVHPDTVSPTPEEPQPEEEPVEIAPETSPPKDAMSKKKKKRGYKPHYGSLKSAGVSRMTESLEDTEIQLWEKEARENMSPDKPMTLSLIQMPISCHSLLREARILAHSYHNYTPGQLTDHSIAQGHFTDHFTDHTVTQGHLKDHTVAQGYLKDPHNNYYALHDPFLESVHARLSFQHGPLLTAPVSKVLRSWMQQGRPPGNKEITYDEMGNVVAVVKLNPDRLPNHRVKVGYHVVDPTVEAAEARLDAMKKGKLTRKYASPKESSQSKGKRGSMESSAVTSKANHSALPESQSKTPLPPAMIDTVDIAPGVVIREGQQVRKGPRRVVKKSSQLTEEAQRMLKPITICSNMPTLDVSEILERSTPTLKPLGESQPIPPINPRPPHQPKVS